MKPLILKNKKNRIVTLGTIKGIMISLKPLEERTIDAETAGIFQEMIIRYSNGGFIDVKEIPVKEEIKQPKKSPRKKTFVSKQTENIITD